MRGALSIGKRIAEDRLAMCGIIIVGALVLVAIFAPYLATHPDDVWNINPAGRLQPPSLQHFFGTDRLGADIYSRILFGARITILVALIAATVSLLIGVPIGLVAGYYGSWLGDILMRGADVFLAIPQIVLAIAMAQTLGPSIPNVIVALSVTFWPWFARLSYAETRRIQSETFIEALGALGAGRFRIVALHILPNILPAIVVRTSITMGFAILTAATLGFLGLGAQPPTPEWGRMIAEARDFLPNAWWYAAAPGIAIFAVVIGFNLLGDGLRDVLDPRLRRRKGKRGSAPASP